MIFFCTYCDNLSILSLESTKACLYLSSIIYLPGLFGGGSTFPFSEALRSPELKTERSLPVLAEQRGHGQWCPWLECWGAWSQVPSLPEILTYLNAGRDYLVADLLVKTPSSTNRATSTPRALISVAWGPPPEPGPLLQLLPSCSTLPSPSSSPASPTSPGTTSGCLSSHLLHQHREI